MTQEDIIKLVQKTANSILFDLIGKPEWDKGCTEQHLIKFAVEICARGQQ